MLDAAAWQEVLDHHAPLFADLERGTAAVLLDHTIWNGGGGDALLWRRGDSGMCVEPVVWHGVEDCTAELVFVAMRDALPRLADQPVADRLSMLRDQVREGDMLFFVTRNCADLDVGWDTFLESLGRAFMGACR